MDFASIADILVVAVLGGLGWIWIQFYGMKIKQVELDVKVETMKEDLNRGTEKFDAMQKELREIHSELKKIYGALAGSVWQGVGNEQEPRR